MLDRELLTRAAAPFGVTVDAALFERFDSYARLLTEWNEKMNLTAITDPTDIAVKHFADSLTAAHLLPQGAFSLIDVGTGAGFPGVPLAMLRDDCALTLLDSLNKRLVFLETLCDAVGVNAVRVHARAEDGGKNPALRENFDVATARAVSNLPVLCEYCLPFVRVGGRFLALKGAEVGEELAAAKRAVATLGGKCRTVEACALPPDKDGVCGARHLVFIDKIKETPTAYPRPSAKIAKAPL